MMSMMHHPMGLMMGAPAMMMIIMAWERCWETITTIYGLKKEELQRRTICFYSLF
jgi:hypothetical protein